MVSSNRMDDEKGHQKSSMVAPSSSSDFNRNEQSSVIKKSIDSSSSPTQSLQKFSLMSLSPSAKAISSASDKESGPLSLSVEKIYPEKTEDHSASIAKNDSDSSNTIAILTNVSSNPFPSSDNSSQEYHLKWVKWQGSQSKLPIVTQNSNGSCPLLAIINVLLLRKNITFPPIIEMVTASQLMDYLCDCILNYVPKVNTLFDLNENVIPNFIGARICLSKSSLIMNKIYKTQCQSCLVYKLDLMSM